MPLFRLTSEGFKNLSWDLLNNDFTFVIDEPFTLFPVNKILADFISPQVSFLHKFDITIDEFHIPKTDPELFRQILNLLKGDEIDIDIKNLDAFEQIGNAIRNQELIDIIDTIKNEPLSVDTIVERILNSMSHNLNISDEFIKFAARHFDDIPIEKLCLLNVDTLSFIITRDCFSITSEDAFFQIIVKLFKKDEEYSKLFQYVIFSNLNEESLNEFVRTIPFEFIDSKIWSQFSSIVNHKPLIEHKRYKPKLYKHDKSSNNLFDGIINYLSHKYQDNIHDLNIITVSSSSVNRNHPTRVAKLTVDYANTNYFQSNDETNSWICFDFKNMQVLPTSYSIRSRPDFGPGSDHLKSWRLEASNDSSNWITLDCRVNILSLNDKNSSSLFNLNSPDQQFYRYLRILATEPMISGFNNLTISAVEFFGYLKEY